MLGVIGGLLGGLGGLFGDKSKQSEEFVRDSTTETEAEAQDLSPELLKMLEGLFMNQVSGGGFEAGQNAITARLDQILKQASAPQFDVDRFAKGVTQQATAGAQLDLESSINEILSASGGSERGNSMNALLANKMRNVTAANLAGINSQATATGEEIRQAQQGQLTEGIAGLGGALSDSIINLIQSTRGASNKGKSKSKEHTEGKGTSSGSSKGNPFSGFANMFGSFNSAREDA